VQERLELDDREAKTRTNGKTRTDASLTLLDTLRRLVDALTFGCLRDVCVPERRLVLSP